MNNLDKPAMPSGLSYPDQDYPALAEGMAIRQHAAIELRVPMSGDPELDAMIRAARRLDMATAAMQSLILAASGTSVVHTPQSVSGAALETADALLAASEKGGAA